MKFGTIFATAFVAIFVEEENSGVVTLISVIRSKTLISFEIHSAAVKIESARSMPGLIQ